MRTRLSFLCHCSRVSLVVIASIDGNSCTNSAANLLGQEASSNPMLYKVERIGVGAQEYNRKAFTWTNPTLVALLPRL